ncbi:ATP-dependent helicase [Deinococcus radiophilus]|nr:ATP-dependent helicase [Deinococcus radiophilus]UFA51721.1 hypothetical protein LMT64_12755 [Deinococcus radiophilus]
MPWPLTADFVQTMHGAKGLEWDHVIVVVSNELDSHNKGYRQYWSPDGQFVRGRWQPAADTDHSAPEEARLRYVALSRAQESLVLLYEPSVAVVKTPTDAIPGCGAPMQRAADTFRNLDREQEYTSSPEIRNLLLDRWWNTAPDTPPPFPLTEDEQAFWSTQQAETQEPREVRPSMYIRPSEQADMTPMDFEAAISTVLDDGWETKALRTERD